MIPGFQNDLLLRLDRETGVITTAAPLRWVDPSGHEHIVPAAVSTDGMSVPWFLSWVYPTELRWFPATFHDYLYRKSRPPRRWADDLFFHAMVSLPIGCKTATTNWQRFRQARLRADWVFRCWLAWLSLRLFGWRHY